MKKKFSKKQRKNLQKFRNAKFNYSKFVKNYYMEKGEAYITVKVDSIKDIISKYSIKGYEWINPEFAEYIEESAYYIPMETGIIIEICGAEFTDEEKEIIEGVIKNYFGLVSEDKEIDIILNRRKANILLAFGIVSLLVFIFVQNKNIGAFFSELLFLAIWFFIWEYGDYGVIRDYDLKLEKIYAGQLASAKIKFIEDENESESKKDQKEQV